MSPTAECEGLCYGCRKFFGFSVTTSENMVRTVDVYEALFHPEREEGSTEPFVSDGREVLNRCPGAPHTEKEHCYFLGDIEVKKIAS
jgi:hypothetical protein